MTRKEMTMFYTVVGTTPDGKTTARLTEPKTKDDAEKWIKDNHMRYIGWTLELEIEDI